VRLCRNKIFKKKDVLRMESTINTLKYGNVEITVADRGAELRSYKVDGEEFMWDRKPEFWAATSPVLFPCWDYKKWGL